jgi:hypothetical protein
MQFEGEALDAWGLNGIESEVSNFINVLLLIQSSRNEQGQHTAYNTTQTSRQPSPLPTTH